MTTSTRKTTGKTSKASKSKRTVKPVPDMTTRAMAPLVVRIPADLYALLSQSAADRGVSLSEHVRDALIASEVGSAA